MIKTVETIVCRACQTEKEPEQFRVQSRSRNGRDTLCKGCRALHRRANGEYLRQLEYRHAKRAGQAVPYVTVDDFIDIFEAYKDCPYCGVKLDDTNRSVDHVYPLSSEYAGKHVSSNIVACCVSCNSSKCATPSVYAFYKRKESFTDELFHSFVQKWISRMVGREIKEREVTQMVQHLKDESDDIPTGQNGEQGVSA